MWWNMYWEFDIASLTIICISSDIQTCHGDKFPVFLLWIFDEFENDPSLFNLIVATTRESLNGYLT